MGEILPDGSVGGYAGYCRKCGKQIKVNIQGDEIGGHECLTECYFTPDSKNTSSTICANCGKEKMLHTIGEGIKATKIIIKK